jgi:hypothetical protein
MDLFGGWTLAALASALLVNIVAQVPTELIMAIALLVLFTVIVLFMTAVKIVQPTSRAWSSSWAISKGCSIQASISFHR